MVKRCDEAERDACAEAGSRELFSPTMTAGDIAKLIFRSVSAAVGLESEISVLERARLMNSVEKQC
jgi:hypothetical protein